MLVIERIKRKIQQLDDNDGEEDTKQKIKDLYEIYLKIPNNKNIEK